MTGTTSTRTGKFMLAGIGVLAASTAGCGADVGGEGVQASTEEELTLIPYPGLGCLRASLGFTRHPVDVTARVGAAARFTVNVLCPEQTRYQWRRNGIPILGATQDTYVIPTTTFANDGDVYDVTISALYSFPGAGAGLLSELATLNVVAANSGHCRAGSRLGGGANHSLAVRSNGDGFAWGLNQYGQIGNGVGGGGSAPVLLPVWVQSDVGSVEPGGSSSFTLLTGNPGVWNYGYNGFGQLGDGTYTHRTRPVRALYIIEPTSTASGVSHGLASTQDGGLYTWGDNRFGQLGDGSSVTRSSPRRLSFGDVQCVAGGLYRSFANRFDGTVWGFGANGSGQLGLGTQASTVASPARTVLPLGTRVIDVASSRYNSFALTDTGQVFAWGSDYTSTPQTQGGLPGPVAAIAAGSWHALALLQDGRLFAWGYNAAGQLGAPGGGWFNSPPVQVTIPGGRTLIAVGAGDDHSLALASDGSVWSWGRNSNGQLGDDSRVQRNAPVRVGTPGNWLDLN